MCVFLSLRARSLEERKRISLSVYSRLFFLFIYLFRWLVFLDAIFLRYLFEFVVVTKILEFKKKKYIPGKVDFFENVFEAFCCVAGGMFCVPAIIFYLFLLYTPPSFFLGRGEEIRRKKKDRRGKKTFSFFLSWTWGACHGLEVLSIFSTTRLLYIYIFLCLVVEISSTATMPVERR